MCVGSHINMGLIGVWPKIVPSNNQHRISFRKRKRRCLGGKRAFCFRWFCSSADFSAGLSKHLKHLSIIHHGKETNNNTMPGGFENSSMKTSFSLSSLQPSSVNLESPGQATLKDRPYSSLRKKPRRDPELDLWRRSWGSREENRDDCWNVLKQVNYQSLISDNNLIDSCQEASKDLLDGKIPSHEWNLPEFTEQFLELNEWLDRIQEAVYPKDAVMDKKIRLSHMEEMKRNDYKRKLFNNQGGRLVAREPGQKEEVAWRVVYLNSRWERLEAALSLRKRTSADSDICPDVDHELRGLRKWIKETEKRLTVLKIRHNDELSEGELEERSKEEEIVRREVWSHGKIVRSLLRLCERLSCGEEGEGSSWVPRGRRVEREDVAKYAQGLEKRWQLLYLDCLELECAIQHKTSTLKQGSPLSANPVDSDEEPVKKHRRLADSPPTYQDNKLKDEDECLMDAEDYATPLDVDEVMEVEVTALDAAATTQPLTEHQPTVQLRISDVSIIADDNLSPRPEMPITLDVIDDRKLYIDEIAKYTRSDCNGRVGTFYFMHKDTDTETDGGRGERGAASPDAAKTEESSEEEWTYTAQTESNNNEETNDHQPETVRPPKEMIKQLVKKAEKLVLNSPQRVHNKSFVEDWLLQYPEEKTVGDSCDASGEYTTEDDELESRICGSTDSFNQDLETTLVQQGSLESLGTAHESSKVVMRAKKKEGRGQQRPWSVSGASDVAFEQTQLPHSISESAIHEMAATAPCVKMDSSMHTGSTLSSSTVEDTTHTQEGSGGGYSSNSLRRRKIKLRKRTTAGRKSESGSEGLLVHSDSSHPTIGSPAKLSFLKSSARRLSADKTSDSPHRRYVPPVESPTSVSSTSSDAESDVSVKMRRKLSAMPSFKIGPAHTLSAYAMDRKPVPVSNDSSYSEQAWDNYQEKYMSEPYSEEPPDSEAARRLLEFGDDYRNFLDSQSDCASSSLGRNTFHRRPRKIQHIGETDSDLDDVWNLINTSKDRLHFSEQVFKNQLSRASPHLVLASDFAELVSTCKDNVKVLKVVLENLEDVTSLMSEKECKELRGLIERWEGLEKNSEDLQKVRFFTREISALKEQLLEIGDRVARFDVKVEDRDQLELRIEDVQREVGRLKSLKPSLLQVNVAVHRFLTETGNAEGPSTLKDEVAELYSTFDETCTKVFSVEENLKDVTKAWQQFESYFATLQIALRSDSENLRKLDEALSQEEGVGGGKVSTHIATSVKDIAKLLSEKEQVIKLNDTQSIYEMMTGGGGNYSDSGISDSGSEVDLSEREKRLAALRRLVRHLEAVLAPGSTAIVNMSKRIEQTEKELRGLQVTCRELIDRTNVYVESKAPPHLGNGYPNGGAARGEGDDSETSGGKIKAWLWRAIRAGLPFQLAVMAILCIACLLEPQCCDAMNNFPYTISPQLRYVKGPPPV